ncbi:hypothetical protein [Methylocystis hirsuta]|uniref:Uncharacterized protein n=1 Tax=Methylocystis hirsuta TaxID=369798 RepID=A0A3M9XR62_9HYPH|nr:hypothetical protein [Methylocystis hirsuta]RNJ49400.1 hypothetical protein D1O30_07080 [Methylocystis hirsuta]
MRFRQPTTFPSIRPGGAEAHGNSLCELTTLAFGADIARERSNHEDESCLRQELVRQAKALRAQRSLRMARETCLDM